MTRTNIVSGLFALTFVATSLAQAQATRTWVSGVGDDTNPCTRTAPCATFAGAIAKTLAGGEIDALDPGGFGPVTITKAITINGGGGQVASVQATGSSGIVVQAGAGELVILRNIDLVASGLTGDGVQIISGGSVHIESVRISGYQGSGVHVVASAPIRVFIDDSSSNNNGVNGVTSTVTPSGGSVSISKSHFEGNNGAGVASAGGSKISVVDSTASGNITGFLADASSGSSSITVTRCDATGNSGAGLAAINNGVLRASNSSSELNGLALSTSNGGTTVSFGNNSLVGAGVFTLTSALH